MALVNESDVVGPPPPMVRDETADDRATVEMLLRSTSHAASAVDALDRLRSARIEGSHGLLAVRSERRPGADMSDSGLGQAVGYLRLTPALVGGERVLVLAPLAVVAGQGHGPVNRNRGIDMYLVEFALDLVAGRDYAAVVTPYDAPFLGSLGFEARDDSAVTTGDGHRLRALHLTSRRVDGPVEPPAGLAPLLADAPA